MSHLVIDITSTENYNLNNYFMETELIYMYKKILVPVDGSETSTRSLEQAAELAAAFGSTITIFHVIVPLPSSVQRYVYVNNLVNEVQEYGREILASARETISGKYELEIDTDMIYGDPANEICYKAKTGAYDLIVMGSRGLNQITSILLGSVSSRVARHAPCAVLIVR